MKPATRADTTSSSVPLPPKRRNPAKTKKAAAKKKSSGGIGWGKALGLLGGVGATIAAGNWAGEKLGIFPAEKAGMLKTASSWMPKLPGK